MRVVTEEIVGTGVSVLTTVVVGGRVGGAVVVIIITIVAPLVTPVVLLFFLLLFPLVLVRRVEDHTQAACGGRGVTVAVCVCIYVYMCVRESVVSVFNREKVSHKVQCGCLRPPRSSLPFSCGVGVCVYVCVCVLTLGPSFRVLVRVGCRSWLSLSLCVCVME